MNRGEAVGHLRPDGEGTIAAVRIAHDEDLVHVELREQDELLDQLDPKAFPTLVTLEATRHGFVAELVSPSQRDAKWMIHEDFLIRKLSPVKK